MRNRTHRYQQRSYKHREQERIPDYFVDEDPYYYYDDYDIYYRDNSYKIVYSESDYESEDSDSRRNKKKKNNNNNSSRRSNKKSNNSNAAALSAVRNRYAALDMEESALCILLGEDNEQQGDTYPDDEEKDAEATILNSVGQEDISRVLTNGNGDVHYSKECLIKTMADEADAAAKRKKWIDSWSEKNNCNDTLVGEDGISYCVPIIICVDGFFRRNLKAGYGVMIRYHYGVPIVASASVYDQGKPVSRLYHTLQGIDRGLELAIKYGFHNVILFYTLPLHSAANRLILKILRSRIRSYCDCEDCEDSIPDYTIKHNCDGEDEFQLVHPLIQEIVQKCYMFNDSSKLFSLESYSGNTKRRYNVPADYLGKLQVNKKEMKPDEFPEELKYILYADAHNWEMGSSIGALPLRGCPRRCQWQCSAWDL